MASINELHSNTDLDPLLGVGVGKDRQAKKGGRLVSPSSQVYFNLGSSVRIFLDLGKVIAWTPAFVGRWFYKIII